MRIVRYEIHGRIHWGTLDEQDPPHIREGVGDFLSNWGLTRKTYRLDTVKLLAPVLPSKVVALGLNYRDHAEELKMKIPDDPMIFLKPGTSVIGPGDDIVYPRMSSRVDYEAELAIVIGKTARRVIPEHARDCVLGYTCANDVTARDLQVKDIQFTRAKGFDTFCPIGPCIRTTIDPSDLLVEAYLNGKRVQSSRTSNLIFHVEELVSFISHVMTLLPGDIIITGTPGGIGPMEPGDKIEIRIENIGSLINPVVAE